MALNTSPGQRVLGITFLITLVFSVFEWIGGKWSGSLALIADAGHMFTDLGGLGLALFAGWMATKRATPKMSFGFYRFEIFAALANGALLAGIAVLIVKEALERFRLSSPIHTHLMLAVAFAGLLANLFCAFLLARHAKDNINFRGAFFHVMGDALSSVVTIAAGLLILKTGWRFADPAASFFIAALIVVSAWKILKDVAEVLLEAAPAHINIHELKRKVLAVSGIHAIHDLHIWSISSGKVSLSAHLEVESERDGGQLLGSVNEILARDFHIHHTTLQLEDVKKKRHEDRHFHP